MNTEDAAACSDGGYLSVGPIGSATAETNFNIWIKFFCLFVESQQRVALENLRNNLTIGRHYH